MKKLAGLTLILLLPSCTPHPNPNPNPAPNPTPVPTPTPLPPIDPSALIDTYEFYVPTYPTSKSIAGTAYYRDGENLYLFTWGAERQDHYLKILLDGDIWLMEDRTYTTVGGYERWYSTGSGIEWLARYMHVGDRVNTNVSIHVYTLPDCRDFGTRLQAHSATLVDHRYQDVGGDLGLTEVIEVNTLGGEGYLYGKGVGLLGFRAGADAGWSTGLPGTRTLSNTFVDVTPPHPQGCQP